MTNQEKLNQRIRIKLSFHIQEAKEEMHFWEQRKQAEEIQFKADLKKYRSATKKEVIKEMHEKQEAFYEQKIKWLQNEIESTKFLINEIDKEQNK